ncbi:10320_t:CDS:2, partial [Dentiscutata erythropus]
LDIDLGENKDHETGNDVEEMFDTLISLVQENNETLEWVSHNMVYSEPGEVTDLIEELNDLINEQRDSIKVFLLRQKYRKNNDLTEDFMTMDGKLPTRLYEEDLAALKEKEENLDDDRELKTTIIDNNIVRASELYPEST